MRNITVIIALLVVAISCTTKSKTTLSAESSRLLSEPELKERLLYEKMLTDTLFSRNKDKIIVLAKLVGKKKLVEVENEQWPEGVEVTFHLLSDATGRITRVSEFPYSESGDWMIMYSHYFDL